MKKQQKEFLKWVHDTQLSPSGKKEMELLFPKLFKKEEPRNGWYKDPKYPKWLGFFEDGFLRYGVNTEGFWFKKEESNYKGINQEEKATDEEVVIALDKIRLEKGLVAGCVANNFKLYNKEFKSIRAKDWKVDFQDGSLVFITGPSTTWEIMKDGEWATVTEESKTKQAEQLERVENFLTMLNKANKIAVKAIEEYNK
jgi:hypothetical protein